MVSKIISGALFGLLALTVSTEVFAQAAVNEKRQSAMKANSAAVKAIKAAAEAKDYATVEAKAKDINGTAERLVSLFPAGSNTGKTKASGAIWEKADDFAKGAKALAKASGELAAAAKAGNDADVTTKMKAVGDTCGACHKAFRAEKYGE